MRERADLNEDRGERYRPLLKKLDEIFAMRPRCEHGGCSREAHIWQPKNNRLVCRIHGAHGSDQRLQALQAETREQLKSYRP